MAEAILVKCNKSNDKSNDFVTPGSQEGVSGVIEVKTFSGEAVTCRQKDGQGIYTITSNGIVCIPVKYGVYLVSVERNTETIQKEVVVSYTTIYKINFKGKTYGIEIDMSKGDPTNAVSYIDDAVGFIPLRCDTDTGICNYGSWKDIIENFIGCKPCMWKNGERTVYLNPDNYAEDIDGNSVDITSGNSGDVMVEFKRNWYKYSVEGNILKFEISDYDRTDEGFQDIDTAFLSEDNNRKRVDYIYWGAYEGWVNDSKLRSLSGKTVTTNYSYLNMITYAANNHNKCAITAYTKLCYMWGLLMLVTKSRDIQTACGMGNVNNVDSSYKPIYKITGTANTKGLFYGTASTKESIKTFGIENFWGNYYEIIAGIVTSNSSVSFFKARPYYEYNNGSGGLHDGYISNSNMNSGYPTSFDTFLNGAIIFPKSLQSNMNIGWPDNFVPINNTYNPRPSKAFGSISSSYIAGPFYIDDSDVAYNTTNSNFDKITARLSATS